MTLNHNYGCSNEAVAGIAGNVLRLCDVADKTHTNFKLKTDYASTKPN